MKCQLQSNFRLSRSNWVNFGAILVLLSATPSAVSQESVPPAPAQQQAKTELDAAAASAKPAEMAGDSYQKEFLQQRYQDALPRSSPNWIKRRVIHRRINDLIDPLSCP